MKAENSAAPVRLVLVGDHPMFVEPLHRWLSSDERLDTSVASGSAEQVIAHCVQQRPEVAVIGHQSASGAATVIRRLRLAMPGIRLLLLVPRADVATARIASDAGCAGIVSKQQPPDALVSAVLAVRNAQSLTVAQPLASAVNDYGPTRLTGREQEVLRLLAEGLSTPELCAQLYVSRNTARAHVQRVISKLGAHSKLEAVAIARRAGLV